MAFWWTPVIKGLKSYYNVFFNCYKMKEKFMQIKKTTDDSIPRIHLYTNRQNLFYRSLPDVTA